MKDYGEKVRLMSGWIGVDLDGTVAEYGGWQGADHIGAPIPLMVDRVKKWLADGVDVRIFTARVNEEFLGEADAVEPIIAAIKAWCLTHIGYELPITYKKDFGMIELWDDRCVQVEPNTGRRADGKE